MKIFISLVVGFFVFFAANGQAWQTSSKISGSSIEPKLSKLDNLNNLIVLSSFTDTVYNPYNNISRGLPDLFLTKSDPSGNVLWHQQIGSTGNEFAGGIAIDNLNNIYISGNFNNTCFFTQTDSLVSRGKADIFLAKYSPSGNLEWKKRVATGSEIQYSNDIILDNSNNVVMCGFFRDSLIVGSETSDLDTLYANTYYGHFIAMFNSSGHRVWAKRYLGTSNLIRISKLALSTNGYYIGGYYQGSLYLDVDTLISTVANTYDNFIYKTDFNGNGQWVRRIRGQNTENFRTLTTDEYDNVYVLGNYNSPDIIVDSTATVERTFAGNIGGYDTYIGKYNRNGILQWFIRKGGTAKDVYNDFVVRNNLIYATGYFANQIIFNTDTLRTDNPLNEDAFLVAFNETGDPISGVSITGTGNYNDAGTVVNMDASSRAYVSGYYRSQQIQIGSQIYTSTNVNKSDLFFAIYAHPFEAVITDQQNVSCNGGSDGLLEVTPYFGRPPFSYSWSHNPSLNSSRVTGLPAGNYVVTITDANNTQAVTQAQVTQPLPISIAEVVTPVSCNGGSDGAINITVSGGTRTIDYSYFWTSADGSGIEPLLQDQDGLTRGTYNIAVLDDNNCEADKDLVVSQPPAIKFTGTTATPITIPPGGNGAVNLSAAGGNSPYVYAWTGPGSFTSASEDLSGLSLAGLYSLLLTDSKDCTSDTAVAVIDNFTLVAQITSKTDLVCFGDNNGSATVTVFNGQAPFTYDWSDGFSSPLNIRTGMAPGNYTVLVTDNSASTAQASVTINGPSSGILLVLDADDLRCYNDLSGVANLTVSGGTLPYWFLWNTGYTGEDLVNVPEGLYSVTVTDAQNCTGQSSIQINEPNPLVIDIDLEGVILCAGGNEAFATASASGGTGTFTYLWNDPGNQNTKTAFDLRAGTYTVIARDQNNCTVSDQVTITEPQALSMVAQISDPSCNGGADGFIIPTLAGGTPAYDYIWSNGVFQRINPGLSAGTYLLQVTDANNCSVDTNFVLANPLPLLISQIDSSNLSCYGAADGSITITASGGTGDLGYSVDGGQTFVAASTTASLNAGTYETVVRDAGDCLSAIRNVTLSEPSELVFDAVVATDASCYESADGTVEIEASGGTGILLFSADDGTSFGPDPVFSALTRGDYLLRLRDESGCESELYTVSLGPAEPFLVDTAAVTRPGGSLVTGSITLESTGGVLPVAYVLVPDSSSNTTGVFTNVGPGTYRAFAYDANTCRSNELTVTLPEGSTSLIIYDAFSPNDDGYNDVWNIGGAARYPQIRVSVFNTWGTLVFHSRGYGEPWDGTHNGSILPSGTYYYLVDPGDGSEILTGTVNLVK